MLKSCKYSTIGLHLLLLVHIAHTFVLLTANVDDVKKLARKFVSNSLAEKIADFIAKATQQIATKGSEERPDQDSHQVSEENNMYNVGRHGESGAQDRLKSKEDTQDDNIRDINSNSFEGTTKFEFDNNDIEKEKSELPRLEGPSRYAAIEPNSEIKRYGYQPQEKKSISRISEEDEKYEKEYNQNKYLDDNFATMPSTAAESYIPEPKPRKNMAKGKPYRLFADTNSVEQNEVADYPRKNDTMNNIFGSNLFQNRAVDLTTRKAVFEFDEYESKSYPKPKFVATSGPLALPRMPNDKWWEKEMPNAKLISKTRPWFE